MRFLLCTFRRWVIDELEAHEISLVWLIPMVENASPVFADISLEFPVLSKIALSYFLLGIIYATYSLVYCICLIHDSTKGND